MRRTFSGLLESVEIKVIQFVVTNLPQRNHGIVCLSTYMIVMIVVVEYFCNNFESFMENVFMPLKLFNTMNCYCRSSIRPYIVFLSYAL